MLLLLYLRCLFSYFWFAMNYFILLLIILCHSLVSQIVKYLSWLCLYIWGVNSCLLFFNRDMWIWREIWSEQKGIFSKRWVSSVMLSTLTNSYQITLLLWKFPQNSDKKLGILQTTGLTFVPYIFYLEFWIKRCKKIGTQTKNFEFGFCSVENVFYQQRLVGSLSPFIVWHCSLNVDVWTKSL